MIDDPWLDEIAEQAVAFVAICVARNQIQTVMGPGLSEIRGVLKEQGVAPAGPWLTHHHYLRPGDFHFDICVPVMKVVAAQGRVRMGVLEARKVAGQSWRALMAWVAGERLAACVDSSSVI